MGRRRKSKEERKGGRGGHVEAGGEPEDGPGLEMSKG